MNPMGTKPQRFGFLRRKSGEIAADFEDELRTHLELRIEALMASGLSRDEARREAIRRFGDIDGTRRYCRRQHEEKERTMQRRLAVTDFMQDMRIAVRGLARVPVLTLTIVGSVGLGIGAATAMFAILDAALLRPLPYAQPEQLVRIFTDAPPYRFRFSVADYLALAAQQTSFTRVAAYADRPMTYTDGASAERLRGRQVSSTYLDTLSISPVLGRAFTAADARPGAPPAVILSHHFWQQRLGGSADAIGKTVRLDSVDYGVVGVLPAVTGPLETGQDYFAAAQWDSPPRKGPFFITAIGRLPDPAKGDAAAAELRAINKRIFPVWKTSYQDEKATWGLMDLKIYLAGEFRGIARLALGAVALVWLIACVNASNLLVARVTSRRRELAVRAALGASRARVVRYLFAESAVLAVAAAALGCLLAWIGMTLARTAGAQYIPRAEEIVLGGRTLLVLASVTLFSGLLFGLIPAVHGAGGPVGEGLRSLGRSSTGSVAVRRLRGALVGSQFAIATPLLVVAGLLIVSLSRLGHVDLGFDTRNVLTGAVMLPAAQYRDDGKVLTFWDRLRTEISAVPGVTGVAYIDSRPPDDAGNQNNFDLEEAPSGPGGSQPVTTWVDVSPEYLRIFGLTLIEGRWFDTRDTAMSSPSVVVVDQAWARRFFPGQSALGKRLKGGGCSTCDWTVVVGVVSGVKYDGLGTPDQGVVYTPMAERGEGLAGSFNARTRYLAVRTAASPDAIVPQMRRVLRGLDPDVPLARLAAIDDLVDASLEQPRGLSMLVGVLAIVALALSIVGIYGVMAHYVQQQAKDISIRLALGGSPRGVVGLMMRRGMTVVAWGVGAGVVAAAGLARFLASALFGVSPGDPLTFSAVAALMLGGALVACGIPAARAVAVEPAEVLRND
jgi:putative ABC transport system permease protein